MGKIKKILENELVGGTQSTDVYPITSVKAVYDENNERLDNILNRRGVVNISTNYNSEHTAEVLTLAQALNKVPSTDRVLGFQGKYLASDGWHTIIYIGDSLTSWSDTTKWIDLSDRILKSISINATFAGIATPTTNPGTPDGPVFYLATKAGTYAKFNGISVAYGEAVILQWNAGAWTKKTTGLATEQEIIYDVSARNGGEVFESLSALLSSSNLSTLIPTSVRHGGMSICFVQSSDNKYVQYRLMANTFSTNGYDWEEVGGAVTTAKIADGAVTAAKLADGVIVQDIGSREQSVMSQKAVSDKLKVIRDSLYTEKETKVVTTANLQGLISGTGTFYVIEAPTHVIYKCKSYPWGSVDVCIGFLDKNKKVVKSWSKKDATIDAQGNWCFDVYSDDWEGAYYLRVDNVIVSLKIYKKPERNTIIDYISKVNFETYVGQRFQELVNVGSDKEYRVSGNHEVDNGGNKRSLYNIQKEDPQLMFKLSASEIKEINSDVLYFYICNKNFAGGQFGHGLTVSDGTNTINVPNTFKYNDRLRTFSIDFDYYKIDVSTLDKSKPWKFIVGFGNTISEFNKYRKFIRLSNKLWNGRDIWVEGNARGLINVFDNWTWNKSDDIPTLNDAIIATKEGGTLIIPKGDYNVSENCTANLTGNGVNDAVTIYKPITIIGDSRTRFVGGKAITSAELYDEENKIYVHNINDVENGYIYTTSIWICQDGARDEDTAVVPSEMNALYHKRTHRMNMCSRIYRVNSIDAIKSASKPSFYIDTAANKMYFTIKDGTTLEKSPVYIGRNPKDDYRHNNDVNLLIGPTHDVTIRNIDFAYGRIQVEGVENCTIENCITYGMPGNNSTGFGISPTSKYVKIVNCEICGNSSDGLNCGYKESPIGGSFIDTNYKGTGMSRSGIFVYMKDCWIHDNSDDGISEHGAGCFIIENSLLEYNGISGCTVAGSDSNYIGCIFRKNAWRSIERAGFENLSNDSVGHCLVKDCVAIDNYGQADYSLRSMGLNSYTTFQNCKSIRTETEIPSWVSGYSTLNPVGFEVENKAVNHAVLMDCTSNRTIKTRFGSSADVKVFSGDNIV